MVLGVLRAGPRWAKVDQGAGVPMCSLAPGLGEPQLFSVGVSGAGLQFRSTAGGGGGVTTRGAGGAGGVFLPHPRTFEGALLHPGLWW